MDEKDKKTLEQLIEQAEEIGNKRYHKLTRKDFEDYRKFDYWRYVNGDSECGSTEVSRHWVKENSDRYCPVCGERYTSQNGRSIDHKLPRAQYPWLSLDFRNLWVICYQCNQEKGERHWYEYERYILLKYPNRYQDIVFVRPRKLLQSLNQ
ncbi:MAG: HNH endonuclease [Leptolyngbyaceae cyanobacterium]